MGLYRYITEEETKQLKSVTDKELNEVFQEALQYVDSILIEERTHIIRRKSWFKKEVRKTLYTLYHESRGFDGTAYQARYMSFASNVGKNIIYVYLFGIINCGIKIK